jgi:hypothetical protein
MSLTAAELTRMRNDLGDTGTPPAFTDEELQDLYTDEGESYPRTVLRAIDQLLMQGVKWTDYVQNETQEKRNQKFTNLLKMRGIWQDRVDEAARANSSQAQMVRVAPVRRQKDTPDAECE